MENDDDNDSIADAKKSTREMYEMIKRNGETSVESPEQTIEDRQVVQKSFIPSESKHDRERYRVRETDDGRDEDEVSGEKGSESKEGSVRGSVSSGHRLLGDLPSLDGSRRASDQRSLAAIDKDIKVSGWVERNRLCLVCVMCLYELVLLVCISCWFI